MIYETRSPNETKKLAARIADEYKKERVKNTQKSPCILALSGELGAGKTTFTKALLKNLGVAGRVTSPTFTLVNHYIPKKKLFEHIYHLDWYRLKKKEDLKNIGWHDLMKQKNSLIIVEWPENIPHVLPQKTKKMKFIHAKTKNQRIIKVWG